MRADLIERLRLSEATANSIGRVFTAELFKEAADALASLSSPQEPVACQHVPFEGRCVHCDVEFVKGRPLFASPVEPVVAAKAEAERATLRVCPMRDAICPWGISCPYFDGYSCKDGWRKRPLEAREP